MFRKIKEFYKNTKFRFKGSITKGNNSCNWPQLNAYCGCLELSTGIYIRSAIVVVVVALTLVRNCYILEILKEGREFLTVGNFSEVEDVEFDVVKIIRIYRILEIYLITWIVIIVLYFLFIIITVYAVYMKQQKLLKFIVYVNLPFCVFEWLYSFFVLAMHELHYDYNLRIFMLISYVMELYNFLAIRSYYKRLRGKSLLVVEDNLDFPPPTASTQTVTLVHTANNEVHCRSCTCFIEGNIPIAETVTAQPRALQHYVTNGTNEVVNDQEPNQEAAESIQEMNSGTATGSETRAIRPNTLDLSLKTSEEDKIDLSDVPVIYDEQQLNVGSSPVIEDRII